MRADAAEARCEELRWAELRWAEVESRARTGSLKWQLDRSRSKLKAAVEETQEVRRTAKDALSLQAEVARLEKLLSEASIEPAKRRSTSAAGKERRRLRATLERAENHKDTIKSLRAERGDLPGPGAVRTYVHGFLDTAGFCPPSPYRWARCCLRPMKKPRHPG